MEGSLVAVPNFVDKIVPRSKCGTDHVANLLLLWPHSNSV